jgi:hypothetical protein
MRRSKSIIACLFGFLHIYLELTARKYPTLYFEIPLLLAEPHFYLCNKPISVYNTINDTVKLINAIIEQPVSVGMVGQQGWAARRQGLQYHLISPALRLKWWNSSVRC